MAVYQTINFPKEFSVELGDIFIDFGGWLSLDFARELSRRVLSESVDEDGLGF